MNRRRANRFHSELISEVKAHARPLSQSQKERFQRYVGTSKTFYAIGTAAERAIIKGWMKRHPNLTEAEYLELLNSLCQGESFNEISIASELLESLPKLRKAVVPKCLDEWLNRVHGWAEVDSFCQSKFSAAEVLCNWKEWEGLLTKLASNDNVHKRRASLVLLTKPVRDSDDTRLTDLAFANIDKLKKDKEILVTKAISWLLRDLIRHNRQRVETYLEENENMLPRIAFRETKAKLLTGRKTPRPNKHN